VCDIHEPFVNRKPNLSVLSNKITVILIIIALSMLPLYNGVDSIVNLAQELGGLFSMPILAVFLLAIYYRKANPRVVSVALVLGVGLYAYFIFVWSPFHWIHMAAITLFFALAVGVLGEKILRISNSARRLN
jgi:SSS family solute:Na+ symporter